MDPWLSVKGNNGMTKREQLVGSDRFEDLASAYQMVLVSILDDALRECGIKPKRKRRQVCEHFLYRHSLLHDQSWLRSGGKVVYPLLGFAEHFQNVGMRPSALGKVLVDKDKSYSFDEYGWSVLRCVFEPDDTVPPVEMGLVGEEPAQRGASPYRGGPGR
jgi:hypothetical protein